MLFRNKVYPTPVDMGCPKCATELVVKDENLYCEKGDMYIAQSVSEGLKECFIERSRNPNDVPFSFKVGSSFYCPKHRSKMTESNGHVRCTTCGVSINEFVYSLIERHPHL